MSDEATPKSPAGTDSRDEHENLSAEELAARIARERHELGDTVQALAAKADVPARARDKAAELRLKATSDPGYALSAAGGLIAVAGLLVWRRGRRG